MPGHQTITRGRRRCIQSLAAPAKTDVTAECETALEALSDRSLSLLERCELFAQAAKTLTWFVPGAENYFGRIQRAAILAALDEAKGAHAPALTQLKKADLAQRAETLVADTGWLPEPLRPIASNAA